ncbi:MAG: Gfo/Idh/MocA family oxidoreductase [Actinoplanes sp.]
MTAPPPTSEPIGVAVVGAGYRGPDPVRSFQSSPAFRLRRLCDLDVARAERVLGACSTVQVSADLAEVPADPDVHAVAIATPAGAHLPVATAALQAGKHVLVEKPLAAAHAEGRRLVDEADRRGPALMGDPTYCCTPAVLRIRELQRAIDGVGDLAPQDLSILDFVLAPGLAGLVEWWRSSR